MEMFRKSLPSVTTPTGMRKWSAHRRRANDISQRARLRRANQPRETSGDRTSVCGRRAEFLSTARRLSEDNPFGDAEGWGQFAPRLLGRPAAVRIGLRSRDEALSALLVLP